MATAANSPFQPVVRLTHARGREGSRDIGNKLYRILGVGQEKDCSGFGGSKPVLPKTAQKKAGTHEQGVGLLQNDVQRGLHERHMTKPIPQP